MSERLCLRKSVSDLDVEYEQSSSDEDFESEHCLFFERLFSFFPSQRWKFARMPQFLPENHRNSLGRRRGVGEQFFQTPDLLVSC